MRPTTSTMLQQNNNNNYPCLNMSGSTRDVLQKCSRASLPFPSRLELGLGDLPLIRGLRAWALCSKNRRKASGLLGRGQAPTAPPVSWGTSTACPRPADVYLSGEYGLPLGLDARQSGIGALVTVATLKTSLGSGKTQTQCLFLRTEKGSCLYSTAKPSSGVATSGASSMVGEWLRGKKSGGGGKDAPAAVSTQTGANRVRVRSGRRWRKSGNAAHQEEQQRSCEDPASELALEERQEERDKACLDRKRFPSPQQDGRRARGCHHVSPQTCTQHRSRLQRREGQGEHEGGDGLGRGVSNALNGEPKEIRKERQKNEKEGGLPELKPEQESNCTHRKSDASCDVDEEGEMSGAERNEGLKVRSSHSQDAFPDRHEDTSSGVMKMHTGNHHLMAASDSKSTNNNNMKDRRAENNSCEDVRASANGFSGHPEEGQESEEEMESSSISRHRESSIPGGGSICRSADHTLWLQEYEQNPLEVHQLGQDSDVGFVANAELNVGGIESQQNFAADEKNAVNEKSDENEEPQTDVRTPEQEDGELFSSNRQNHGEGEASELDHSKEKLKKSCASKDEWRLQEDEDGGKTTVACVQSNPEPSTNVHVSCVDPPNRNNPTPSLPPLASMATSLPRLEAEKEEEVEVVGEAAGETQREKKRFEREQGEEERSSKVATEDGSTQEEEEEEEDEFGGFMQAEGEPAWSQEVNMSASVPCGSRDRTGESELLVCCPLSLFCLFLSLYVLWRMCGMLGKFSFLLPSRVVTENLYRFKSSKVMREVIRSRKRGIKRWELGPVQLE